MLGSWTEQGAPPEARRHERVRQRFRRMDSSPSQAQQGLAVTWGGGRKREDPGPTAFGD